uniref:Protein daughterless (inferred by orthology to a D. melanogaster protein) n=1 Tax=Strongyloides venezuelensis TaxID=75913 RepID=A0A0K0FK58_STRVS
MSFPNPEFPPNDIKVEYIEDYTVSPVDNIVPEISTENNYYSDSNQRYGPLPPVSDFYHSTYNTWNNLNTENNIYPYNPSYLQNTEYPVYSSAPSYNTSNPIYNVDRQPCNFSTIPPNRYTADFSYNDTKSSINDIQKPFLIENPPSNSSFYRQISCGSDSTGTEKSYSEGRGDVKLVKKRTKKENNEDKSPDDKKDYKRTANNIRERIRVHDINAAFTDLAKICSEYMKDKEEKHTKLTILQQAVEVIKVLEKEVEKKRDVKTSGISHFA